MIDLLETKSKQALKSTKDENNNNSTLSHLTVSNKTNLLEKSVKSSNRSRSHSRKDEDFTAEEKNAIRSMLSLRHSNPSPNPSNHSYSNLINNNNNLMCDPIRANFGSVKNMTFNRNDYYNHQRAFINSSLSQPTSQYHMNGFNSFPTNVHPNLINNPSPFLHSYNSSHSTYTYDPQINY
jgi:hypothetical protein